MRICVLDVETTFQTDDKGKTDPSPYNPDNYLVSVGLLFPDRLADTNYINYWCCKHNEQPAEKDFKLKVQYVIDNADLMVWHNGKFDRSWLLECGFTVPFACWDTMIAEYVLSCGLKDSVSLKNSCIRRGVQQKKSDLVDDYLAKGVGFEAMPWPIVEEYGIGDLVSTAELFWKQLELLGVTDVTKLIPDIVAND
jgi:DNA polymerase I-like protein with 3'-5' exonuclease and polymerase domains